MIGVAIDRPFVEASETRARLPTRPAASVVTNVPERAHVLLGVDSGSTGPKFGANLSGRHRTEILPVA